MEYVMIRKMIFFIFSIIPALLFAETKVNPDSLKVYDVPSITVTSSRAKFLDSPVPFNELNRTEISNSYTTQDLPNLMSEMPSMTFYSQNGNSIGYSILSLRGIDERRISVMINGIPQNDPEDHIVYWIDFPDIASNLDNIQVQRGAGLSGYGPAAIAGSVNLTTSNFVNKKGVKLMSGIGWQEYGSGNSDKLQPITNKMSFEASSGLVDNKYAFYARLSKITSQGYRDRSWTDLNSYFVSAVRYDDNFSTQINIFGGPFSDGLAYTGLPKSYISDASLRRSNPAYGGWAYDSTGKTISYYTDRRKQEIEHFSQPHYEILNELTLSQSLKVNSTLFLYTGEGYFDVDGSWNNAEGYRMTKKYGFDSTVNPANSLYRAFVLNRQWGWIPCVNWVTGNNEITAGLEVRIHRSEHFANLLFAENLPPGYDPDYRFYYNRGNRNIFSGFIREKYSLNKDLSVFAEGSLVHHSYSITDEKAGNLYTTYLTTDGKTVGNGAELFNINYLFFNPKAGMNYLISEDMNVFAFAAYTSHEPRMRNFYAADDAFFGATPLFEGDTIAGGIRKYDFSKPLVKPEKMFNLELGWNWKTENYSASVNAYWMQYTDELVSSGRLDINGNPIDGNAPGTLHYGLEMQGSAFLLKSHSGNLSLTANATFSKNTILEYDFLTSTGVKISLKGNDIAGFPSIMGNLKLHYDLKGFRASLHLRFNGESGTDNFGNLLTTDSRLIAHLKNDMGGYYVDNTLESYTVLNADFSYTFKNILSLQDLRLHLQCMNLTNKLYAAGAVGKEFFPAAGRSIFVGIELGI